MLSHTVQERQGRTFRGVGGCRGNQSKEFSKSIEGDLSVERYALIQYFLKSYNSSLHSFEPYSISIAVLSTLYILLIN